MRNSFTILVCLLMLGCAAQQSITTTSYPFEKEVAAFRRADSAQMPARNQILFIGSSSFTNWKDVQDYFPGYPVLNRAFGGSTLVDVMNHRQSVVFPYRPKQIVMYCGENDFAASDTIIVPTVVQRFKTLFNAIRGKYKSVPFVYVGMKPSPSRRHLLPKYKQANAEIAAWLATKKHTAYVDVFPHMMRNGEPMPEIFLKDSLHMNAKGYAIWKPLIQPTLLN